MFSKISHDFFDPQTFKISSISQLDQTIFTKKKKNIFEEIYITVHENIKNNIKGFGYQQVKLGTLIFL